MSDSEPVPVERPRVARAFVEFMCSNKAWWMTPILLVLAVMVAQILLAEASPALPSR